MATLNGQSIDTTYTGLLKTDNNIALTTSLQAITDGTGQRTAIELSAGADKSVLMASTGSGTVGIISDDLTLSNVLGADGIGIDATGVAFSGDVDFSGATVTGLPGGSAGVIDGTGTNSMETSLTDLPANATGYAAIAFGRNAQSSQDSSVAMGNYANASGSKAIAIGSEVTASGGNSQAYGWNTTASAAGAIALGSGVTASKTNTTTTKALELTTASTPTDGGIIMTDAGSTQRRINVNAGGELFTDANHVVGNHQYYPWDASATGYGATYARTSRAMVGGPFWQAAVDQNENTIIMSQMFVQPGVEITSIIPAFLSVVSDDTYEIAMYDTYADGSPKDKVFTTSVSVVGASGDQYVEHTVSWTPTKNSYWIAIQTANSGNSKIGMMPRDNFANTFFTYGAWGASPVGMLSINSLYTTPGSSGLPTNFASGFSFGHRDEGLVMLYKTA